jgi:hypothetical protein
MIPDEPEPTVSSDEFPQPETVAEAGPRPPPVREHRLAVVLAGVAAFVAGLCILGFASLVAVLASNSGLAAFGLCFVIVAALFVVRWRSGPSPYLSAIAVGAAVALVVVGGCIALFTGGGRIGG